MKHGAFRLTLAATAMAILVTAGSWATLDITPSHVCGDCHRDIYRMWRESAHASALEDPVFLDAYHDTRNREGKAVSVTCLECHAPLAAISGDEQLQNRVTWEGVNCEYCHGMVSVDDSVHPPRARIEISQVKYGPVPDAESNGHDVAYSPLHQDSKACAPCHEYINGDGTPIMTTYSEWLTSSAAEDGASCQTCHMELTDANVVDPRIKRTAKAKVNLHRVPGGHSLEQLHEALSVAISPERMGDDLSLNVRITNRGAGHAVPTGMPGRRVILDLTVETSRGKTYTEKRVYEKTFRAADGSTILRDSGFFASDVKFHADTRIQPDERRLESFRFPMKPDATAYISVKLHYEHAPMGPDEEKVFLTFLSERRVSRPVAPPQG